MPTSSSVINACGVTIEIEDENGVLVDISGSSNEVQPDFEQKLGEYNVFGDRATYRIECKEDASLKLVALYSTAMREARDLLKRWKMLRGQRRIVVYVPNKANYTDRFDGQFLWEKLSIPLKADEAKPIMVQADLKPSGVVNWDTTSPTA